jgi:hypothetical protein
VFDGLELASRLFVNCIKIQQIWDLIFKWLYWKSDGWSKKLVDNFFFNTSCKRKKSRKVYHLIWLTTA